MKVKGGLLILDCPIHPSFDRVVLREDTPEEVTERGIIIPTIAQEKEKTAVVVAVGPDCSSFDLGDHVIHTKYAGMEIEVNRVTYVIIPESEILGWISAVADVPESEPDAEAEAAL